MKLDKLPIEMLVLILQTVDIPSLLNLRHVCRKLHDCIKVHYQAIAPAAARATFPVVFRGLLDSLEDPPSNYTLQWLTVVRLRWLAAVLIERPNWRPPYSERTGFSADDPAGDEARAVAYSGLSVLVRLSNIDKRADLLTDESDAVPLVPYSFKEKISSKLAVVTRNKERRQLDAVIKRESKITHRRLALIESLDDQSVAAFSTVNTLIAAAFLTEKPDNSALSAYSSNDPDPHSNLISLFDWSAPSDSESDTVSPSNFTTGRSWVNWYLLHAGPELLFSQWAGSNFHANGATTSIRTTLLAAWKARSAKQIAIERYAAERVFKAVVLRRYWGGIGGGWLGFRGGSSPVLPALDGGDEGQAGVLGAVPFVVDFSVAQ